MVSRTDVVALLGVFFCACAGESGEAEVATPRPTDVGETSDSCVAACAGRECGDDGCGGECGLCESGNICGSNGLCQPAACEQDADCGELFCSPVTGLCVDCVVHVDCPDGALCVESVCVEPLGCESSLDCPGNQVCGEGVCVDCSGDEDCPDEKVCGADQACHARHDCSSDKDCKDFDLVCDKGSGLCVDCLGLDDCLEFEHCVDSYCLVDFCHAGEAACQGKEVVACNDEGSANVVTDVCNDEQYCESAVCHDVVCVPGEAYCVGEVHIVCDDIGKRIELEEDCEAVGMKCIDAACVEIVCVPRAQFCVDDFTTGVCNDTGLEYEPTPCPVAHYCIGGVCYSWVCEPDTQWCEGTISHACNEKGSFVVELDCAETDKGCKDGACKEYVCESGQAFCLDDTTPALCFYDGFGFEEGECPEGSYCEQGSCHVWACNPGDSLCQGSEVHVCNAQGSGLDLMKDCAATNEFCLDGECVDCIPDCTGKECGDDGCGGSCGECAGPPFGCQAGACVCLPDCGGKECGDDGCSGSCGQCNGEQELCVGGTCQCQPACAGKDCGIDGCGGDCGQCDPGQVCIDGQCPPPGKTCDDGNQTSWDGCTAYEISEFVINTTTQGNQHSPSLTSTKGGGWLAVWQGWTVSGIHIMARGMTAAGELQALEWKANAGSGSTLYDPRTLGLPGGHLVVVWTDSAVDGAGKGIAYRVFDSQWSPLTGDLTANSYTIGDQQAPAIAQTSAGGFIIVWRGDGPDDDSGGGIYARLFNSAGAPLAGQFPVNEYTFAAQHSPAAARSGEKCAVAWYSVSQDGASGGIAGQLFDAAGGPTVGEFIVNGVTENNQKDPALAGGETGFAAVWVSNNQDGDGWGVFFRRFDTSGQALCADIQVNSTTAGDQETPSVTSLVDSGYAVVWLSPDGVAVAVRGQRLTSSGTKTGGEFKVNTAPVADGARPAIAGTEDGGYALVWCADGVDGDSSGILVQRFNAQGAKLYQ